MKVTITHLKAPWPVGAAVGDVVEIDAESLPGWAAGKCSPAADDAEAAHVFVAIAPPPVAHEPAAVGAAPVDADALKRAEAMLAEARTEADELRARLEQAEAAVAKMATERDAAVQRAEQAEAAVAAAAGKKK